MKDGHIHTPFCPHGSTDPFDEYVKKAIKEGLDEMTFTEHLPLPDMPYSKEFLDECGISYENLPKYISKVNELKNQYSNNIKINFGFEVDYVDGFEQETQELLNTYGEYIEDSILSVHFVKLNGEYRCIDMPEDFKYILDTVGSLEEVYNLYYLTLLKSIDADLGVYKPKRIGHPTLVRKFCLMYPYEYKNVKLLEKIIKTIKEKDYEIDYNTAGLRKELCGEIYPTGIFNELVEKYNVRKVYGSDSHEAKDVGAGFK